MPDDLEQLAAAGDAEACLIQAKRLLRGRGTAERNYEEAVRLFDTAARGGSADAYYQLGKCYLKGIGCTRDPGGGVSCLEQAARMGHKAAAFKLGVCFENGTGAPASTEMAAYWYRKAAAAGELRAYDALNALCRRS